MKKYKYFWGVLLVGILGGLFVSCKDDEVKMGTDVKTETSINYTITISPDLLKFITPRVRYVDENGNLITITGVEELDGKVIENTAEVKNGESFASCWTSQIITGTGYKCWTIQMKFSRLDFHSYMCVEYLRNDFTEDVSDKKYDFHHNVNTNVNVVKVSGTSSKAFVDSHVSITIGNYKKGDDIEKYLADLAKMPDKVGYFVDENGDVARKDDF